MPGAGEERYRGNRKSVFNGVEFQFKKVKNSGDDGEGCTTA